MIRTQLERIRDLPYLPVFSHDEAMRAIHKQVDDASIAGREALIATLESKLRFMRNLGLKQHWAYSLPLHEALLRLWRKEVAELTELKAMQEFAA